MDARHSPGAAADDGISTEVATLFGESASRVILSVGPQQTDAGWFRSPSTQSVMACAVDEAEARWSTGLSQWLDRPKVAE